MIIDYGLEPNTFFANHILLRNNNLFGNRAGAEQRGEGRMRGGLREGRLWEDHCSAVNCAAL